MNITSYPELIDYIDKIGFLPLLYTDIAGNWSADAAVDSSCRYRVFPEGGWEWKLWQWKGPILRESGCAYGRYFRGQAGFVSRAWWPDYCNYHRSKYAAPVSGSIEETVLETLRENGHMTTGELRDACGFTGKNMRGRMSTVIARLELGCRVVTEDFVYKTDRHGRTYGWGSALLTVTEERFGREACHPDRSPEDSYARLRQQFEHILPHADDALLRRII